MRIESEFIKLRIYLLLHVTYPLSFLHKHRDQFERRFGSFCVHLYM
jgi:hypothetical protein